MSDGIDWLGLAVFENDDLMTCVKMTLQGETVGHYARCLKHGTRADITASEAAMMKDAHTFCAECQRCEPRNDWDKPSEFATFFGSQPIRVEVDPKRAIPLRVEMNGRCQN